MATLNTLSGKVSDLKTIVETLEKKGKKYFDFTISVNDEVNNYNQNVVAFISQSKEDREAKKPKFYIGNGKTVWSSNNEFVAPKNEKSNESNQQPANQSGLGEEMDNLPF